MEGQKYTAVTPNFYAVIPAKVRYDKELVPNAKLLYGELTALTSDKGFCWATNAYFADLYDVHEKTVSEWISMLEKQGHIRIEPQSQWGARKIWTTDTPLHKKTEGVSGKDGGGCSEKTTRINTISNTYNLSASAEKDFSPPKKESHREETYGSDRRYVEIDDEGNEVRITKTGKRKTINPVPYVFDTELKRLQKSWDKKHKIVAHYWASAGIHPQNREQFESQLARDLKAAKSLTGYNGEQVDRAINHCKEKYDEWTLETVRKAMVHLHD